MALNVSVFRQGEEKEHGRLSENGKPDTGCLSGRTDRSMFCGGFQVGIADRKRKNANQMRERTEISRESEKKIGGSD